MQKRNLFNTVAPVALILTSGAAFADAHGVQPIDIPAQPLQAALTELSEETGLQVMASDRLLADKESAGVRGPMTPAAALAAILEGTGLIIRNFGDAGVVVSRADLVTQNLDDEPFLLETIIIEGELLARDIQDTPTSVVVITGEELERDGDSSILDKIRLQPNVDVASFSDAFRIRGIDQRGIGGGGLGSTISTQIDGVALPSNQAFFFGPFSPWDLQQVEVLRGPQSTQQGRNALAGAVIIRSQDPTYEEEVKSQIQFGSRNTRGAAIAINQPLIDETLALRFSAEGFATDGENTNITLGQNANEQKRNTIRAKLRWDPNPDLNIIFNYTRSNSTGGQDRISAADFPENRFTLGNLDEFEGNLQNFGGVRVEYQLSDIWTLEAETSFFDDEYERLLDFDGGPEDLGVLQRTGTSEVFEQDIRLRFDTATMTGVVGLFYTETESDNPSMREIDVRQFIPIVPAGLLTVMEDFNFGTRIENYAVYGEVDYDASQFVEGLSFTVGARYDNETVTSVSNNFVSTTPPICPSGNPIIDALCNALLPTPDPGSQADGDFSAFLPKFGVTYDWTPDISTSFTAQRSYRSGGAELVTDANAPANLILNEFDPEFTWTYELALRAQFMDQRLTTNANIFFTDWEDQQLAIDVILGNPVAGRQTVNAGTSELWGAELLVQYEVTPEFDVFGSVGYLNTEFTDFVVDNEDLTGNEFPNAPSFSAVLGASYAFANGLTVAGDISYTGSRFADPQNSSKLDSYFVVNGTLTYEWDDNYSATLYARNLFDEDYILTSFSDGITVGEARTIGVVLNATF